MVVTQTQGRAALVTNLVSILSPAVLQVTKPGPRKGKLAGRLLTPHHTPNLGGEKLWRQDVAHAGVQLGHPDVGVPAVWSASPCLLREGLEQTRKPGRARTSRWLWASLPQPPPKPWFRDPGKLGTEGSWASLGRPKGVIPNGTDIVTIRHKAMQVLDLSCSASAPL